MPTIEPDHAPEAPPADPEQERPNRPGMGWVAVIPAMVLLFVLATVRIPYFIIGPGPASDVEPLIQIDKTTVYPSKGHLLLTAVTFQRASPFQAVAEWIDPAKILVPERELLAPGQTDQQEAVVARSEMDTSKIDAAVVALSLESGYPAKHGTGALVENVYSGTPAEGRLFAGDLVTAVNGTTIQVPEDVSKAILAAGTTGRLDFTVTAAGQTRHVTLTPARIKGVNKPIIGVSMVDNFPFPLNISSGNIGGPSAGLAWTLGLIDLLTPGDLTGGRSIAGTGTIDLATGKVGEIGGVEQKVVAAERAGATIFFCPTGNVAAARGVASHITIVPVRTYTDALEYLKLHP